MATPAVKRAAAAFVLSAAGLASISLHEGRSHTAYLDPVQVWTICDGHTKTAKRGMVATDEHCDYLLKQDTREAEVAVRRLVKVPITQSQYDALVDFVFNLGAGAFAKSTLLVKINAQACWAAGQEFSRWVYAKGRLLPGLVKRRAWERKLWESGC